MLDIINLAPGSIWIIDITELIGPEMLASGYLIINYTATSEVIIEVDQFELESPRFQGGVEVAMISPGADGLRDELIFPVIPIKEYLVLVRVSATAPPSTIVTMNITYVH